jgi:ribosomal protein L11 methyltransferase
MPLAEIELQLGGEDLDAWGDALLEAGALSVSAQDALADTELEMPLYAEPGGEPAIAAWGANRVAVLFPGELDIAGALRAASLAMGLPAPQVLAARVVPDEDWVKLTQAQFEPVHIGRLAIVPSWREPPAGGVVIRLDPGVAFGTGTHPTTRLCLAWLERELAAGASVLDFGCGSGILSIAASALGAGIVAGVDIDPQAVLASRENARRNGSPALYTDAHSFAPPAAGFDVVIANILANPLVVLAPSLIGRMAPGGHILLSGILARQADEVARAYESACPGIGLHAWGEEQGWVALSGRKPA